MSVLFADGQEHKRYIAIVRGYIEGQGVIDCPLQETPDAMTDRQVAAGRPEQDALARYKYLAKAEMPFATKRHATSRYSLVELVPETGCKHQLRRHMKHIFHPIVGDTTHGDGRHNLFFKNHLGSQRLLLSSIHLQFIHPILKTTISIHAPPDFEFNNVIKHLNWQPD